MKAVLIVALGRLLQMAAALLTLRLSTTLMSPGDVGQINQMVAVGTLFASGIILPLIVYFARGLTGWVNADMFRHRLRQVVLAIVVATAILLPVGAGVQFAMHLVHGIALHWFAGLLALYLVGFSTYTLLLNCVAVLGQRVRSAAASNLAAWGGLGLATALYLQFGDPWFWVLGLFAGYLMAAQTLWIVRPTAPAPASPSAAAPLSLAPRVVWAFVWPQVIMFALWWTQSQSYRFVLAEVSGVAAVGLFFAAYALISVPMQAFESAFNEVYSPTLYRNFESGAADARTRAWNRYASAYMPSIVVFSCCLAGCAPHFARLALGPAFQVTAFFFVWPAIAEMARALSSANHTLGVANVDMRLLLPPAAVGAIAAPGLIWGCAPGSPLMGTGLAVCVAGLAVLASTYLMTRLAAPVRWPWGRMAAALCLGLPMIVGGFWAASAIPPTATFALLVCLLLGAYAIGALAWLARDWLPELRRAR